MEVVATLCPANVPTALNLSLNRQTPPHHDVLILLFKQTQIPSIYLKLKVIIISQRREISPAANQRSAVLCNSLGLCHCVRYSCSGVQTCWKEDGYVQKNEHSVERRQQITFNKRNLSFFHVQNRSFGDLFV